MSRHIPKVAIGLPVYNGGDYLPQAVDFLLGQSFTDFTLIIIDNASTDRTEEISRAYARRDARVQYIRNNVNIGGIANFNKVFNYVKSPYFKWAAADDLCQPDFLDRCVTVLDEDPEAVFVFTRSRFIDETGQFLPYNPSIQAYINPEGIPFAYRFECEEALLKTDPVERFEALLHNTCVGTVIYGLFRTEVLRNTSRFQFYGADKLLLTEVAMQGHFRRVDEQLFFRRLHSGSTWTKTRRQWASGEQGRNVNGLLSPPWRTFFNYQKAVFRSNLSTADKAACASLIVEYAVRRESIKNLFVPGPDNYWGIDNHPQPTLSEDSVESMNYTTRLDHEYIHAVGR